MFARWSKGAARSRARLLGALSAMVLTACGSIPTTPARSYITVVQRDMAHDVVVYALGLIDTNYRYGGSNPEAGLDCSGMVSHIYEQVTGVRLPHNAAEIARLTRPLMRSHLKPGDLVFFNTLGRSYSHVGIYIGDGRFVHAPGASKGRVQIARLDSSYFFSRYDGARTLFMD